MTVIEKTQEKSGYTTLPGQIGCSTPGCFSDQITYPASMEQLEALIDLSENCEQSIVNNCNVNALTEFGWWEDRNGNNVTYWHGDKGENEVGCQCNDDETCITINDMEFYCNCDSRRDNVVDVGLLTSKTQLPVTKLYYGDSEARYSYIKYDLGNLICSGKSGSYPSQERDNQLYIQLKGEIGELEAQTENELNQVNTQLASHNQRLDDVQEVNYSFKYYPSSKEAVRQGTRVKFDTKVYGSGVDSTGLFTAPIGTF